MRRLIKFQQPYNGSFQFFVLLFALSLPFWIIGMWVEGELLPGLPVSSLMVICPGLSAGISVYRSRGPGALGPFLRRVGDFNRMRPWTWLVSLGTMPIVMALSALALLSSGASLPPAQIGPIQTIGLFVLFFLAATAEELGWTAYATGGLVERRGLIVAGLIIGAVTCVWHLIPLLQADRAWSWIAWWAIGTVCRRILIVWLYARGGQSVFSASLFHAMNNLSWLSFPVMGSHYDPITVALILIVPTALMGGFVGNSRALR